MLSNEPEQSAVDKNAVSEETQQPLSPLPFAVQMQNIFPIEILARRFPSYTSNAPNILLNVKDIQIDTEHYLSQVTLEVHAGFAEEPSPFEILFRMVGQFSYTQDCSAEMVHTFLAHGSLSIMLPFARELLLNLCTRLQLPPIMLALAQISPPSPKTDINEETTFQ